MMLWHRHDAPTFWKRFFLAYVPQELEHWFCKPGANSSNLSAGICFFTGVVHDSFCWSSTSFLLPILMLLVHCCIDYFLLWQTNRPSLAKAGRKRSIWRPPFASGCLFSIFYFENLIQRRRENSTESSSFDKIAINRVGLRLILSLRDRSSAG